jgi:hypothetical protein
MEIFEDEKYKFFATNFLIFLITFSLFSIYFRLRKIMAIVLVILTTVLFISLFYQQVENEKSKYKDFGINRYTSSTKIKSKFRKKSREILNSNLEEKDSLYADLQELVELLGDKNKRIVYDKFERIFENQDFEGKEFKELYFNLLKMTFYEYINICFFWILVSFIFCRLMKIFTIFNHSLKAIVISHFIFVYYMYSHEVDEKSFFDLFLPKLTMHKQIYFFEFIFAYVLGFVWAFLKIYLNNKKDHLLNILANVQEKMKKSNKDCKVLKEIEQNLVELKKII